MQIRIGYSLSYQVEQPTPMIVTLNAHYSRASDLLGPDTMLTEPSTPVGAKNSVVPGQAA